MMDLEDRLRGTFNGMADELPPSANPRGELERRLAGRGRQRWRMPVLVAAAAAVVAAVAVPVVVFGGSGGSGTAVGTGGIQPTSQPGTQLSLPDTVDGHEPVARYRDNGTLWTVFAVEDGADVCSSPESEPETLTCPEDPPGTPPNERVVQSFSLDPVNGPMGTKFLFVTAPEVATLEVRNSAGADVGLAMVADGNGKLKVFLADFGGPSDGYGYTAREANGNIIEEALT